MTPFKSTVISGFFLAALLFSSPATAEPLLVGVELSGAVPLTEPQTRLFNPGGSVAAGIVYPIHPIFLMGVKLRLGLLLNGSAPDGDIETWADPGTGGFGTLNAVLRLRPFAKTDDVRRGIGPFVEGTGGGAITGKLQRGTFDVGLGWGIELGKLDIAPTIRYLQIIHDGGLDGRDARLILFGVEVSFFDDRPIIVKPPQPPKDRDKDGIIDLEDSCPEQPEDKDDYQDEDGCPDPDNDKDSIEDRLDKCPNKPEDIDDYEDDDGCPDPDNDQDSFLDQDDDCPNEPEIINGNKDFDGCPDEGVIQMVKDRIVLEERVLFDLARARVKSRARPVLRAIKELQNQHPEWISLRIEGHSDAQGDKDFNQELSERRAHNVMRELIKLGIPENMIDAVGYGSSRLRDRRNTEEGHKRNRRVEFVVLARKQPPSEENTSEKDAGEKILQKDVDVLQPETDDEQEVPESDQASPKQSNESPPLEEDVDNQPNSKKIEEGSEKGNNKKNRDDKSGKTEEERK